MRRISSTHAFALCAALLLALALPVAAQESAEETLHASANLKDDSGPVAARRAQLLRRGSSYLGPVGGIHVIEAGSGAPGSLRLQLMTDFFFKSDYLFDGDDRRYVGGALSVSVTPVEHLELTSAVSARSVRNPSSASYRDEPESVKSIGDPYLDIKSYGEVANGLTLGADVLLAVLTAPADDALDYAGMSVGLRGNISLDLRRTAARAPLELRLNGGYYFDQSHKVVEQLERERLSALVTSGRSPDPAGNPEYRHLAYRNERLAYGVNRVDHASLAVGLEAPLALSKRVSLHPIAEWELWIPVDRQDYDCPRVEIGGKKVPGDDSCLGDEGASSWPQRVTAGARLYPALAGFSLLAAVEVGLGGMNHFVREFAPTAPYRVLLAAAYTIDFRPTPKRVEKPIEEPPPVPKEGRLLGKVVEQGVGTPVANATVSLSGSGQGPLMADAAGQFVSAALPPGELLLEVAADGYRPGSCGARIPAEGGDTQVQCELVPLPRVGSIAGTVVGADGAPVAGVTVQLSGPASRSPVTASDGSFREVDLPPGDYQAHVDQPGYLVSITHSQVELQKESTPRIILVPKPKKSLVVVEKTRIQLRETVYFNTGTAELEARSEPLLLEVADALLRTPAVLSVEVQGHTDNVGAAEYNLDLSQRRAEAVRDWLVRAGVAEGRLVAKGYGMTKPIASNKGEKGRSKNRRVAFIILERAEGP